MHYEEAAGDLSLGLRPFPVSHGRVADTSMKEATERSEALKAYFEADVSDAKIVGAQQLFRFLDASLDQVLMRSLVECLSKQTKEMITRETSLFGNLIETQRMVVAMIDKLACPPQPLQRLDIRQAFRIDSSNHVLN